MPSNIDPSALLGVLGLVASFLLGWAAKQTLDRLMLPRILDWFARRQRNSSQKRAEHVLEQFLYNLRHISDTRHLIIRLGDRLTFLILWTASTNTTLIILLIYQQSAKERLATVPILLLLVVLVGYAFVLLISIRSGIHETSMLTNLEAYRGQIVDRLRNLLAAAGLADTQIEAWLERVPPLPAPVLRNS